jgi:hypothetical protein
LREAISIAAPIEDLVLIWNARDGDQRVNRLMWISSLRLAGVGARMRVGEKLIPHAATRVATSLSFAVPRSRTGDISFFRLASWHLCGCITTESVPSRGMARSVPSGKGKPFHQLFIN